MQQTAVNPPAAAARVPVAMSSLYSWPGSRRWACRSMSPGTTQQPRTSTTRVALADTGRRARRRCAPITPSSMSTSASASRLRAGSITRPPRRQRSISPGPLDRWSAGRSQPRSASTGLRQAQADGRGARLAEPLVLAGLAAGQQVQDRHADRHAARDLVEDHRARAVGDRGIDLDAAVDRARGA